MNLRTLLTGSLSALVIASTIVPAAKAEVKVIHHPYGGVKVVKVKHHDHHKKAKVVKLKKGHHHRYNGHKKFKKFKKFHF